MKVALLELQVRWDMLKNGYDPTDKRDIQLYWEWKLS